MATGPLEFRIVPATEEDWSTPDISGNTFGPPAAGEEIYVTRTICGACATVVATELSRCRADDPDALDRLERVWHETASRSTFHCTECGVDWRPERDASVDT